MTSTFPKGRYVLSDTIFCQDGEWQTFLRYMSDNSTDLIDKNSPVGLRICDEYQAHKIALFVLSRAFIYGWNGAQFSGTKGMMVLFPVELLKSKRSVTPISNLIAVGGSGIDHILEMPDDFDVVVKGTTIHLGKHTFTPIERSEIANILTERVVGRTTGDYIVQLGWFNSNFGRFEWDKPISTRLKWSKSRKTIRLARIPFTGGLKTLADDSSKKPLEFAGFVSTGAYAGMYLRNQTRISSPVMRVLSQIDNEEKDKNMERFEATKLSVQFSQSLNIHE